MNRHYQGKVDAFDSAGRFISIGSLSSCFSVNMKYLQNDGDVTMPD